MVSGLPFDARGIYSFAREDVFRMLDKDEESAGGHVAKV